MKPFYWTRKLTYNSFHYTTLAEIEDSSKGQIAGIPLAFMFTLIFDTILFPLGMLLKRRFK